MININEPSKNAPLYPDLTPLLDIIFIVMVFLMLTASVRLESLDVALPATDSNLVSAVETESLTVNILTSPPYWALNSKEYIDWDNFKVALLEEAKSTNRPIIIAADKAAEVQHLVKLLAFMQDNGIPATQLLTEEAVN